MNILLLPFLDESPSFVHGYECGRFSYRIAQGEVIDYIPVHAVNVEQLIIICEYHGYEYTFTPMDDTWVGFTARPVDISGVV